MDLVTTHINADLDGLASMVALSLLKGAVELGLSGSMDRASRAFLENHRDELPPIHSPRRLNKRLNSEQLETLYVVDTADPTRLGELTQYVPKFAIVEAWDNHPPQPGDLFRVEMPHTKACVSALVLELVEAGIEPTPCEAGLFLCGIHVDTGHFTFMGTTELDHQAAAACLGWGAPADWPNQYSPKGYTARQLELLERMAQGIEFFEEADLTVAFLTLELESYEPDLAVLLEQLREVEKWPVAFLLASSGESIFVIGRSTSFADVGLILRRLGGGGHPEAASAVLRGVSLLDGRAALRQVVAEVIGEGRCAGDVAVKPFQSIAASAQIKKVSDTLHRLRLNALPLTVGRGENKRFVGTVSRQEVDAAIRHGLGGRPVHEISSAAPAWVPPQSPLSQVRKTLLSGGRLVVVGSPPSDAVGIITRGTLFRSLAADPNLAESRRPPHERTVVGLTKKALNGAWPLVRKLGLLGAELEMPVYLVGGTVRDVMLRLPVRDIDLVVDGSAPKLARAAAKQYGGWVRVHEAFATACWTFDNDLVLDLASTRTEYYQAPAALPTITHAGFHQDLYRRDFTINALAVALDPGALGKIRDPFGGLSDLYNGIVRVLHGLSFHDDPTRAFRAARFAARFEFKVAKETLGLMNGARRAGAFERLSDERLGSEFDLLLEERHVARAFRLLAQWRLLTYIHPKFAANHRFFDNLNRARAARHRFEGFHQNVPSQADVLWIVLSYAVPQADRESRYRLVRGPIRRKRLWLEGPNRIDKALQELSKSKTASHAGRALEPLTMAERVIALARVRKKSAQEWLLWWEKTGHRIKSDIDGNTLLEKGLKPSPKIALALRTALDEAREGKSREEQLKAALERGK